MGHIVAFGEILLRLSSPERQLLLQTPRVDVWVGGAEANVVSALARMGHDARLISALPEGALGNAALAAIRACGVNTAAVRRSPGRMGLYWVETGAGIRATEVTYDRAGSAFVTVPADEWAFDRALADAALLHLSGITPALGPNATRAALEAAAAATARGIPLSFDGNYRARLWDCWPGDPRTTLALLVGQAEIFFGNHRDIALLLDRRFDGTGTDRNHMAARAAFAHFPRLRMIASTDRVIERGDRHRLIARLDMRDGTTATDEVTIDGIVDRIGTGDAFAAGVLHGLLENRSAAATLRAGLTLSALKHSVPGDMAPFDAIATASGLPSGGDVRR